MYYLASPYTHPNPIVVASRYAEAMVMTYKLMKEEIPVFSPIVHCHEMAQRFAMPKDYAYWKGYNRAMLARADELLILTLDGWEESKGVQDELAFATKHGKGHHLLSPFCDVKGLAELHLARW